MYDLSPAFKTLLLCVSRLYLPLESPSSYAPTRVSIILHQMGWGGVDRVAVILAKGFAERGIETELLVCARGGEGKVTMKDIIGDKVTVHFFRQTSGSRAVDLLLGFL